MGLYAAAHYKNSPNDLQLLADGLGFDLDGAAWNFRYIFRRMPYVKHPIVRARPRVRGRGLNAFGSRLMPARFAMRRMHIVKAV